MCSFFSFCGDGHGNYRYTDWVERVAMKHAPEADSHTAILTRAGVPVGKQHLWSAYEYNPFTKVITTDRGADGHDHEAARNWADALDWSMVVAPLRVKSIVDPLALGTELVTRFDKRLLREWASVWASVGASVGESVGASVWASVGDSVGDSVWDSVWDSVGESVGDSVWASVGAYTSSFFAIPCKHDFTSAIRLWERGLVPSYDGKTWRLHGGKKGAVLYKWTPKEAKHDD